MVLTKKIIFYLNNFFRYDLFAGLLSGLYTLTFIIAAAALIFKENLSPLLPLGIISGLIGTVITNTLVGMRSQSTSAISYPPIVLCSLITIFIAKISLQTSEQHLAPTLFVAIGLGSIVVGATLFLVGYLRITYIFRFIPYPVMGGFIAGMGGMLINGSLAIGTEKYTSIFLFNSSSLLIVMHCLPTLAMGILLFSFKKIFKTQLVTPLCILLGIAVAHLVFWFTNNTLSSAITNDWVFAPHKLSVNWQLLKIETLQLVDWMTIFNQYENYFTLIFITLIMQIFNVNALEIATEEHLELAPELELEGMGNMLGGILGGMLTTMSFSGTVLNYNSGAKTRISGYIASLFCIIMLCVIPGIISYIPKFVVAGLIFALGLILLHRWLYESYFQLMLSDYLIIIIIFFTAIFIGFLSSIIIGIIITCFQFIFNSSRINLIKFILNGENHQSNCKYSIEKELFLHKIGKCYYIYKLQGLLFFGNTIHLLDKITELTQNKNHEVRYIILDFQLVLELDCSACFSFANIKRFTDKEGIQLIFSHCNSTFIKQFKKTAIISNTSNIMYNFSDLNEAVEWCEKQILQLLEKPIEVLSTDSLHFGGFYLTKDHIKVFLTYLIKKEFSPNEFIFHQGEPSDSLYFIQSGRVKASVRKNDGSDLTLYISESGTLIGEMGFYLDSPRSASVKAEGNCITYKITRAAFEKLKQEQPEITLQLYHYIVCILSERLGCADREISEYNMPSSRGTADLNNWVNP